MHKGTMYMYFGFIWMIKAITRLMNSITKKMRSIFLLSKKISLLLWLMNKSIVISAIETRRNCPSIME